MRRCDHTFRDSSARAPRRQRRKPARFGGANDSGILISTREESGFSSSEAMIRQAGWCAAISSTSSCGTAPRDIAPFVTARPPAEFRQDGHGFSITLANAEGTSREERCRFLIIATGARSQLSRRLGLSGNAINAPSLTTYRMRRNEPDFGLRFFFDKSLRPGYSWEFDADSDTVNIGICALAGLPGHEIKKRSLVAAANWPSLPNSVWRGGSIPLWSGEGATGIPTRLW